MTAEDLDFLKEMLDKFQGYSIEYYMNNYNPGYEVSTDVENLKRYADGPFAKFEVFINHTSKHIGIGLLL